MRSPAPFWAPFWRRVAFWVVWWRKRATGARLAAVLRLLVGYHLSYDL